MPKVVFLVPKGLLFFMGSVGLGPGSKFSLWYGLGWVEQIGPTDNSGPGHCCYRIGPNPFPDWMGLKAS